jgi:hypothetical protein
MSRSSETPTKAWIDRLRTWLRSDVTLTLPGWAVALGGVLLLFLLLASLD